MQELPEKTTPQSLPEDEQAEEETQPVNVAGEIPADDSGQSDPQENPTSAEDAAPETDLAQTQLAEVTEQAGTVSGSDDATSEPAALAEPAEPVISETETAPLAAETAAPLAAQIDEPAVPQADDATPTALEEIQVTASGAVVVPGEEAPRAEEPRPKKAPVKPEKPTGPRISDLQAGQVVEGTVTRIEKYGAFVNLGLADRRDGLIHISELSSHRIRRVEDVVQVGEPVRARVVSVDLARGRIALSLNDVDAETAKEASVGPAEPALTSMALAFQQAQNREREAREKSGSAAQGKVGDRKRREQEELMRRLQAGQ